MGGDLSGPDLPIDRSTVVAVASALFRKGVGFRDVPPPIGLGLIGRPLLHLFVGKLLGLASLGRGENLVELPIDASEVDRLLRDEVSAD